MISNFLKRYWVWMAAALVLGTAFFYLKFNLPLGGTRAQLTLNFENGESRKFEGAVAADMTILEALYSSSLGGDFELRYSMQEDGAVALAKIDGIINFGNRSWHFYLNKTSVKTSDINKIKIKTGDFIEAKYE